MKQKIMILSFFLVFLIQLKSAYSQTAEIGTDTIIHNTCYDGFDGEWHLDTANFQGNLRIIWSTGDVDTLIVYNLHAGSYWYIAYDIDQISGDTLKTLGDTVKITEPRPILMTIIYKENPSCYNGQNGKAIIEVSGGLGSYYGVYQLDGSTNNITRLNDFRFRLDSLAAGWNSIKMKDYNYHCYRLDSIFVEQPFNGQLTGELEIRHESCFGCNDGGIKLKSVENAYDVVKLYYNGWYEDPFNQWIEYLSPGNYSIELKSIYNNGYCVTTINTTIEPFKDEYKLNIPTGYIIGDMFEIYTANGLAISKITELENYELQIAKLYDNWSSEVVLFKAPNDINVLPLSLADFEAGAYLIVLKLNNGQQFKRIINVFNK